MWWITVDDALMGITHVIRAEEHLTNTLRQCLILEALGYKQPQYAHCSLILGEDRSKLSKRHGATSVDQFKQEVRQASRGQRRSRECCRVCGSIRAHSKGRAAGGGGGQCVVVSMARMRQPCLAPVSCHLCVCV
jgi:hypothetical protein